MIGTEVKWLSGSEDVTRTLIGMCRTSGTSQFFDDGLSQIGVASWQNRRQRNIPGVGTGTISGIGATSPTFFGGPATVLSLVTWADAPPLIELTGIGLVTADGNAVLCNIGMNGSTSATILPISLRISAATGGNNIFQSWAGNGVPGWTGGAPYSEGWNTFGGVAWVSSTSGSINNTVGGSAFI
jgi:hypothetical protein